MGHRRIRVLVGEAARRATDGALARAPIEHALDPHERVRWERGESYRLLVLRVPRRERPGDLALVTVPLGLVITDRDVVIVGSCESDVVRALRPRDGEIASLPDVLVEVLHAVARSYGETVELTVRAIDRVELALVRSMRNTEVLELLRYQKALVVHSAALRALVEIVDRLPDALSIDSRDRHFLEDVAVELQQTHEVADLQRETLGETMDAFASIISNNVNDVMRVLTAAAVILTPPVTIASLWGMNVPVPLHDHPYAFAILTGISTGISVLVFVGLRVRRWL